MQKSSPALAQIFEPIRADLERVDREFGRHVESHVQLIPTIGKYIQTSGGKRMRPVFAWTGWIGAGGDPSGPDAGAVLRACSALELVQAGALVHDDIIDASTTRRGYPTVHVEYAEHHRAAQWLGVPERFGEAAAICSPNWVLL